MSPTTRHVLVAPGGRPRLVTEALYLFKTIDGVVFDEIHIVATPEGRLAIEHVLLDKPNGQSAFSRACRGLRIDRDEVVFNARTIHVPDLRVGAEQNEVESFADAAYEVVRALTAQTSTRLTIVVPGDDAVSAALLSATLQMVGRAGDRLQCIDEHLVLTDAIAKGLVSNFLFPDRDIKVGRIRVKRAHLLTRREIPLVLLGLPPGAEGHGYLALAKRQVRTHRLLSEPAPLSIDLRQRLVQIDGTAVKIAPSPFFWYAYLASTAPAALSLSAIDDAGPIDRTRPTASVAPLVAFFESLFPHRCGEWVQTLKRACGPDPSLRSTISKLNTTLRNTFGAAALPYLVKGGRGATYRLDLSPSRIRIHGSTHSCEGILHKAIA